jgi:hypothetical protein
VAQNAELSLVKTDSLRMPILEVDNPNGVEGSAGAPFFWLGTKPATLMVFSPDGGRSTLAGRFTIGPSNPTLRVVDLTITSDAGEGPRHFKVAPGRQEFAVQTRPGLNHFTLQVENAAVKFLPSDRRPLLLRVDEMQFRHEGCGETVVLSH